MPANAMPIDIVATIGLNGVCSRCSLMPSTYSPTNLPKKSMPNGVALMKPIVTAKNASTASGAHITAGDSCACSNL